MNQTERSVTLPECDQAETAVKKSSSKLSEVFRRDGYTGASLADLAGAVGLGKASLYQKFPQGKVQIGAEVLAETGRTFETEVLAPLREPGTPEARFSKMLGAARKFYEDGKLSCVLDTLSLGEAGQFYRETLSEAITHWQEALTTLGREAGLSPAKAVSLGRRSRDYGRRFIGAGSSRQRSRDFSTSA